MKALIRLAHARSQLSEYAEAQSLWDSVIHRFTSEKSLHLNEYLALTIFCSLGQAMSYTALSVSTALFHRLLKDFSSFNDVSCKERQFLQLLFHYVNHLITLEEYLKAKPFSLPFVEKLYDWPFEVIKRVEQMTEEHSLSDNVYSKTDQSFPIEDEVENDLR